MEENYVFVDVSSFYIKNESKVSEWLSSLISDHKLHTTYGDSNVIRCPPQVGF